VSHTPGPWIASRYGTVFAPGGRTVALASYPEDAALIAAAPDLLAAAEAALAILRLPEVYARMTSCRTLDSGDHLGCIGRLDSAIAKAKEESK